MIPPHPSPSSNSTLSTACKKALTRCRSQPQKRFLAGRSSHPSCDWLSTPRSFALVQATPAWLQYKPDVLPPRRRRDARGCGHGRYEYLPPQLHVLSTCRQCLSSGSMPFASAAAELQFHPLFWTQKQNVSVAEPNREATHAQ